MRLAKRIAMGGLASRREAEVWITQGWVTVNGERITNCATCITEKDVIHVRGKKIPSIVTPRLWRYYKPRGLLVSHGDPQGRPIVFSHLPSHLPRVISVGRLDYDSEGLLLLTSSGDLARFLEHPEQGWKRVYHVKIHGAYARDFQEIQEALYQGITIQGIVYRSVHMQVLKQDGPAFWIKITLVEGKNREIRRMASYFGWQVERLQRQGYGPFILGDLLPEAVEEVESEALHRIWPHK